MAATKSAGSSEVSLTQRGDTITLTGNGIPDHLVGSFPNSGNPNRITEQKVTLRIPADPDEARRTTALAFRWSFGVSLDGQGTQVMVQDCGEDAAYLFAFEGGVWKEKAKFDGCNTSLSGNSIVNQSVLSGRLPRFREYEVVAAL